VKLTREELLKLVNNNSIGFFKDLHHYEIEELENPGFQECGYKNDGDGREMRTRFLFPEFDLIVQMTGIYSSHGCSEWYNVNFVEPYQHTETRYKNVEVKE
jgi:hypothetical protein